MIQQTFLLLMKTSGWSTVVQQLNSLFITICSVHFFITLGGSIVALHTERHKYIFDLIDTL